MGKDKSFVEANYFSTIGGFFREVSDDKIGAILVTPPIIDWAKKNLIESEGCFFRILSNGSASGYFYFFEGGVVQEMYTGLNLDQFDRLRVLSESEEGLLKVLNGLGLPNDGLRWPNDWEQADKNADALHNKFCEIGMGADFPKLEFTYKEAMRNHQELLISAGYL